jgi:hypothetical protein
MAKALARPRRSYFTRINLLTSLLLVFPVLLFYQVGVVAVPEVLNGADLLTGRLVRLLDRNLTYYLLVQLALLVAFIVMVAVLRRRNEFQGRLFVPLLLESALYAVTMGGFIVLVMTRVLHVSPLFLPAAAGPATVGPLGRVILSAGAGVHEETVFRLMMVPGLIWLGEKGLGLRRALAIVLAFLISSVLFSAAHHVIGGEPYRTGVFVYRLLCGLIFATLFQFRGFAVAVYTHFLYDVFVLLVHG